MSAPRKKPNRSPWAGGAKVNPDNPNEAWCTAGHVVHVDAMAKDARTASGLGSLCRFHMREQTAASRGGVAHGGTGSQQPNAYSATEAVAIMLAAGVLCDPDDWVNTSTPFPGVCLECGAATTSTLANVNDGKRACLACSHANHPGSITWRTLGRNVDDALKPRWFYVIRFRLHGRTIWKVGVGTDDRVRQHVRKGGTVVLEVLTTKASAYELEQRMLDKFKLYRCAQRVVPEELEGRTEYVILNPRNCALRYEHRMPLAADPDAAEHHVDFAMGVAETEMERLMELEGLTL